ncbi:MAG: ATP phosphoribosyltransferase regulatory subunit [Cyanobacteriota bacterium]|jgi:ATP phosphoribosyltransferase regulatory subunit
MIHHPPAGARDLLPLEVAQKAWINDRLQAVFHRWGYQRIVTSTLEWLDTLVAGGAIHPQRVLQLQGAEGSLGLRPELTASIARTAVTRLTQTDFPQRLCYRANVFRQPPQGYPGKQMEFYQAGVELLYVGGVGADAEIILLLGDCLQTLGLERWQLVLGDAGLTRRLLARLPEGLQPQVKDCIANLDWVRLENLDYPDAESRALALQLFDLRGAPGDILGQLEGVAPEETARLQALLSLLTDNLGAGLILDLSWLQPFDYYTGIVFQAVQGNQVLGQGGRYDQLLALYHPQRLPLPGVGFSLNIEELHDALLDSAQLPQGAPVNDYLVIPENSEALGTALRYAQALREKDPALRVELALQQAEAQTWRDYAHRQGVKQLIWVGGSENVRGESLETDKPLFTDQPEER